MKIRGQVIRAAKARRLNRELVLNGGDVVVTPAGRRGFLVGRPGEFFFVVWQTGRHTRSDFQSINVPLRVLPRGEEGK